jgi:hypothetical protein
VVVHKVNILITSKTNLVQKTTLKPRNVRDKLEFQIMKRRKDLNMATRNIRTMLAPGKKEEIAEETVTKNIDIPVLQEVRYRENK